jgi:hypothetical protein
MTLVQRCLFLLSLLCLALPAQAIELTGTKTLSVVTKTKEKIAIGKVVFTAQEGGAVAFKIDMDHRVLKDFFLSMKEFKCVDGSTEIMCHVPYPYKQPGTVTATNFAWLEHSLLFMYKQPKDFGAVLWNGIYFELTNTPTALVGKAQAIDLNRISAPSNLPVPPYGKANRDDIPVGARWIEAVVIE